MKTMRDVTPDECPWLPETVPAGTEVFEWKDYTYGVASHGGVAVSRVEGEYPFFELPWNALDIDLPFCGRS